MIAARALLATVLLLATLSAQAKPADHGKPEARKHYDAGLAHFNLREYAQAIEEFQAAYRIVPDPVFLYNLAQSYRLSNDAEQALYFYRTYVRMAPTAPNRPEVDERIATLERLIAEKRNAERPPDHTIAPTETKQPTPPETAVVTPPAPTTTPAVADKSPAAERTPVYKRWWLWTVGGVVVAGVAVGLGVGLGVERHASFNANVGTFGPNALQVRF
jgi:iron complex outermembrane receptor protein